MPTLETAQRQLLDLALTKEESREMIKAMRGFKPPRPDGFPREFYAPYSDELSEHLLEDYDKAGKRGTLSQACGKLSSLCSLSQGMTRRN
ncbi:hypothetical protein NDU88_000656 [Pleurodeles waltl]|uniref:Uncharacterized protein n=1 Tax=Pleurodeles waltl TaxID=8319 RepID=A0AAV7KNA6_PLEWA|nr:hypothetical protein NDU88_000656 [Pleurodeles waltl]